jgi:hypothetical protein
MLDSAAGGGAGGTIGGDAAADEEARLQALFQAALAEGRDPAWPAPPPAGCSACGGGAFTSYANAARCQLCPPGRVSAPLAAACDACPPGSYAFAWGSTACRPCLAGTYAPEGAAPYCQLCATGTVALGEGAAACTPASKPPSARDASRSILVSFSVLFSGMSLDEVSPERTGINASSADIVIALVRADVARALRVPLDSVKVVGLTQLTGRVLVASVSATVALDSSGAAAGGAGAPGAAPGDGDLSADELIQRMINDPDAFQRTTRTLGAHSAYVQDLLLQRMWRLEHSLVTRLHAILWPATAGVTLILLVAWLSVRRRSARRRRKRALHLLPGGGGTGGSESHVAGGLAAGGGAPGLSAAGLYMRWPAAGLGLGAADGGGAPRGRATASSGGGSDASSSGAEPSEGGGRGGSGSGSGSEDGLGGGAASPPASPPAARAAGPAALLVARLRSAKAQFLVSHDGPPAATGDAYARIGG